MLQNVQLFALYVHDAVRKLETLHKTKLMSMP